MTAHALNSQQLAAAVRSGDYSRTAATVIGYGNMGREFVAALREVGGPRINVCSRFETIPAELAGVPGLVTTAGGFQALTAPAWPHDVRDVAIVAMRIDGLADATRHLVRCGYRRILIEKPVALHSRDIEALAKELEAAGVDAFVAYNRVAYPAFHEARARAVEDGGITSCAYTFTEFVDRIGPGHFTTDELDRWGVANSLHVMSMAHGFIGLPDTWSGFRGPGGQPISWHPAGAVFVGSGISTAGIPFTYHADWGSRGRWSVEINTLKAAYRLCPLETLLRKTKATGDWEPVEVTTAVSEVKVGILEQVAAMLDPAVARVVPLVTLRDAARLTRFAEEIFGYKS